MTPPKPGEKPRLYVDGIEVDAVYDAVNLTLTPVNPMSKGSHNVQMTYADQAGNVSPLSVSNLTVVYQVPTITVATPIAGDNTISSTENPVTVTGTTTDVQQGQNVVVTFKDTAGITVTATAAVDGAGKWTASAANLSTLTDGTLTVTANTADKYGNTATGSAPANLDVVKAASAALASAVPDQTTIDEPSVDTDTTDTPDQTADAQASTTLFDSSSDVQIDAKDEALVDLSVWNDANSSDTDAGELFTMDQLDMTFINLTHGIDQVQENGSIISGTSQYGTADGQDHAIVDAYFAVTTAGATADAVDATSNAAII